MLTFFMLYVFYFFIWLYAVNNVKTIKRKAELLALLIPYGSRIVDNVRTVIQRQNEYIYIPDLRGYFNT